MAQSDQKSHEFDSERSKDDDDDAKIIRPDISRIQSACCTNDSLKSYFCGAVSFSSNSYRWDSDLCSSLRPKNTSPATRDDTPSRETKANLNKGRATRSLISWSSSDLCEGSFQRYLTISNSKQFNPKNALNLDKRNIIPSEPSERREKEELETTGVDTASLNIIPRGYRGTISRQFSSFNSANFDEKKQGIRKMTPIESVEIHVCPTSLEALSLRGSTIHGIDASLEASSLRGATSTVNGTEKVQVHLGPKTNHSGNSSYAGGEKPQSQLRQECCDAASLLSDVCTDVVLDFVSTTKTNLTDRTKVVMKCDSCSSHRFCKCPKKSNNAEESAMRNNPPSSIREGTIFFVEANSEALSKPQLPRAEVQPMNRSRAGNFFLRRKYFEKLRGTMTGSETPERHIGATQNVNLSTSFNSHGRFNFRGRALSEANYVFKSDKKSFDAIPAVQEKKEQEISETGAFDENSSACGLFRGCFGMEPELANAVSMDQEANNTKLTSNNDKLIKDPFADDMDDTYYDSDPGECTSTIISNGSRYMANSRTSPLTISSATVASASTVNIQFDSSSMNGESTTTETDLRETVNHGSINSFVQRKKYKSKEQKMERLVNESVKEISNRNINMVWHKYKQSKHKTQPPVRIKAWIEPGSRLRNQFIQPKFMWSSVFEPDLHKRKLNLSKVSPESIELLEICSIIEANSIDRSMFPLMKPANSFVINTADGFFLFEADSEKEKARYMFGLKHVVARFVSKLIVGDYEVYDEFFSPLGSSVPGEVPTVLQL